MRSIKVRQHIGQDGVLHLEIPTEVKEGDVEVVVVYQPVPKIEKRQWSADFLSTFGTWEGELMRESQEVDDRGWPVGFFERTYGIGIFGSYAIGEQTQDSDIDVLIDYEQAPTLFDLVNLQDFLADLTGLSVDVVTKNGLKPRIRDRVLAEVIYV